MARNGGHYALIRAIVGTGNGPVPKEDIAALKQRFSSWRGDLVVTHENIQILLAQGEAGKVTRFFQDCGYRVVVVLYLREQAVWLNSLYCQGIKSFRFLGSIADCFAGQRAGNMFDFSTRISAAEALGCGVIVRHYGREVRQRGIVSDFFAAIGHPVVAGSRQAANDNPGPIALSAAQDLHRRLLAEVRVLSGLQKVRCMRALREEAEKLGADKVNAWYLTPAQTDFVRGLTAAGNRTLADRFWEGQGFELENFPRTVFDQEQASAEDKGFYTALAEAAWPRLLAIAADADLAASANEPVWSAGPGTEPALYSGWPED